MIFPFLGGKWWWACFERRKVSRATRNDNIYPGDSGIESGVDNNTRARARVSVQKLGDTKLGAKWHCSTIKLAEVVRQCTNSCGGMAIHDVYPVALSVCCLFSYRQEDPDWIACGTRRSLMRPTVLCNMLRRKVMETHVYDTLGRVPCMSWRLQFLHVKAFNATCNRTTSSPHRWTYNAIN